MPGNRKVKCLYEIYCRIYSCRKGFMPGTRKDKCFRKCIFDYIVLGGASCPGIGGLNVYMKYIVEYIHVGGASCPGLGRVFSGVQRYKYWYINKLHHRFLNSVFSRNKMLLDFII